MLKCKLIPTRNSVLSPIMFRTAHAYQISIGSSVQLGLEQSAEQLAYVRMNGRQHKANRVFTSEVYCGAFDAYCICIYTQRNARIINSVNWHKICPLCYKFSISVSIVSIMSRQFSIAAGLDGYGLREWGEGETSESVYIWLADTGQIYASFDVLQINLDSHSFCSLCPCTSPSISLSSLEVSRLFALSPTFSLSLSLLPPFRLSATYPYAAAAL